MTDKPKLSLIDGDAEAAHRRYIHLHLAGDRAGAAALFAKLHPKRDFSLVSESDGDASASRSDRAPQSPHSQP